MGQGWYRRWLAGLGAVLAVFLFLWDAAAVAGETLERVRARGILQCGVMQAAEGLGGFDADICRALAAALLGDAGLAVPEPLPNNALLDGLAGGALDIVARYPTGLTERSDVHYVTLTLATGQGFMVPAARHPGNAAALAGRSVCVAAGGDADRLAAFALGHGVAFAPRTYEGVAVAADAFFAGACDSLSAGRMELAALRAARGKTPSDYVILDELLERHLSGPFTAAVDAEWAKLVRWVVFALIEAEERGLTTANVDRLRTASSDPAVRRFLGEGGGLGDVLGLADGWVAEMLRQVGNFGEIYDRNLGAASSTALARGPNALWRDGGMLIAMPVQ